MSHILYFGTGVTVFVAFVLLSLALHHITGLGLDAITGMLCIGLAGIPISYVVGRITVNLIKHRNIYS